LPPLCHPRSRWLQEALPDPERHFKLVARVRDALDMEVAIRLMCYCCCKCTL
jgi:hypothetical protein